MRHLFIPLRNLTVLNIWMDLSSCYWNGSLWIKYWQHTLLHLVISIKYWDFLYLKKTTWNAKNQGGYIFSVWYIWFYHLGKIMTFTDNLRFFHLLSGFCCVRHVFPPHVSIFGLFPVLVKCHYELILVQPCLSHYLWFTCVFIVLSVQFDLVWSTCDSPVYLVSLPCRH